MQARNTKQKQVIWEIFEQFARPLSPAEVHEQAVKQLPRISIATVYRIIRGLHDERRLASVALPGAPDRYEMESKAAHHHHHFHCDGCGRVFDVPGCGLRVDSRLPVGFSLRRHEVVLYGDCDECVCDECVSAPR
jgi:Fur family ferric uptake transcriptional regulator